MMCLATEVDMDRISLVSYTFMKNGGNVSFST